VTSTLPAERALLSHRLTEVPLRDDDDRTVGRHRVLGTLAIAHGAGRPVVVAWVRSRRRGPVQVFVGGVETGPEADDAAVGFPAGARGRQQSRAEVDTALSALVWEPTRLALDAGDVVEVSLADRLEHLFTLTGEPMAFLAVARPLGAVTVGDTIDTLSDDLARLEALRAGRGVHRRELERAERNLTYLDRSLGVGCWELELWTGGVDVTGARVAAAMVAGSGDVAEVPLLVRSSASDGAGPHPWSPTVTIGADAVAAILRPPFRELPGVRVTPLPEFDQNVEDKVEVRLGSVLDGARSSAAPFGVSLDSVNRHVFVSGATGSGKSETVRSLLLGLNQRAIPWMVIEPAKAEYAGIGPWLDPGNPLVVVRPGDPDTPPPMINPLEPSSVVVDGVRHIFPLQTHLDMVKALFVASFEAQEPFPQVLSAGLTRAYQSRGWNLVTGRASNPSLSPPRWPSLGDLVTESLTVVENLGYGAEVRNNMRGFVRVRVESLRTGTSGRFFEGGYPVDLEDLLARPTVFEIEDLGDDQDKAFFIGSLVIRVVELLRLRQKLGLQKPGLSHVLVIEEAHRLLRRVAEESPTAHAVTMFANLLAEVRAYGEGVVVAEQIPSKVIPDLVKNSAVKVMHRLPAHDDRTTVGATMNLTDAQSTHVVALEPGTAVAHSAGMDRPVLVRIDRVSAHRETGAGSSEPSLAHRAGEDADESAGTLLTLGQLESARDLVTPALALWAEQIVVAHLTYDVIGAPAGQWFTTLQQAGRRRARCAIGLAVSEAVTRRFALIRAWYDPDELAAEVTACMAGQLETASVLGRPDWKWAVGQYRYTEIRMDLRAAPPDADTSRPHPSSDRWRAAGIDLPGPTWADQLAQVDSIRARLPQVWSHQLAGSPPVLEELAASLGYVSGSQQTRIARAVGSLGLDARWLVVRVGAQG
jgi:hypothetical protein